MRAVVLFLILLLLLPLHTIGAQDLSTPPISPSLVAVPITPGTVTTPEKAFGLSVLPQSARAGRDRGKGALYGAAIGALVGGAGLAGLNYALTTSIPRDEYTRLLFFQGAAAGGAAGAIVGAIVGVPERGEDQTRQAQLHIHPNLDRGGIINVSLSLPSR